MVESIRNNTVEKKQQKTNRYVNIHLEKEHEAGSVSLSDIVKKVILIVTDSLELPYSDFERKHTLLFFFVRKTHTSFSRLLVFLLYKRQIITISLFLHLRDGNKHQCRTVDTVTHPTAMLRTIIKHMSQMRVGMCTAYLCSSF